MKLQSTEFILALVLYILHMRTDYMQVTFIASVASVFLNLIQGASYHL